MHKQKFLVSVFVILGLIAVAFGVQATDITPPVQTYWNPPDNAVIEVTMPAMRINLNESGDCRVSQQDKSYIQMTGTDDTNCTGDGTIYISCRPACLGTNGVKTIYVACQDLFGNKDTADTNTKLTYTIAVYHKACNTQKQCVQTDGPGYDLCGSSAECANTHNECNTQKQCVVLNGVGTDECSTNVDCFKPVPPVVSQQTHTECLVQKCLSIRGVGTDQCNADEDCQPAVLSSPGILNSIADFAKDKILKPVGAVAKKTKEIAQTPEGKVATDVVSTTGIAVATTATASTFLTFPFFDIFLMPLRLLGLLMTAFGIKKRTVPWGVVYDSVTKQPLDPAYVVLKNLKTGESHDAITDLDGRYGFLVGPGTYRIVARKTNYTFPSQKLVGKDQDELHADLYFGEDIEINSSDQVIVKNIPLDPVKFDWNEFAKRGKKLMRFYSKWDITIKRIYSFFFTAGFTAALAGYAFAPRSYNTIIIILYLILTLLIALGVKPKTYGYIIDKETGNPLSFAIIRVMVEGSNREVSSKLTNKYGKYYCLINPGEYFLQIEKKEKDGSYNLIYISPTIDVSQTGIINKILKV